jgi:hypothetical protein
MNFDFNKGTLKSMKRSKYFVAILSLLLLQSFAYAQDDFTMANLVFPSENQVTQAQLTPLTATELKEIQNSIELPTEYCLDHVKMRIADNSIEEWLWGFYKYDFSGDGIDDLIFISYCGGEEYRNYFWVKKDKKYYYSGLAMGTLVKLYRTQDSKALSVVTRGGFCCLGYIGFINLYTPQIDNQIITYKLEKSVREVGHITLPEKRMPTKRFIVKNDKYKLREQPVINDKYDAYESDFEHKPVYGNTLAEFSKGSKGEAIAEKSDETGRVWWFVIMDPDARAEYNRFYGDQTASKAGWMSSRFLEVLK